MRARRPACRCCASCTGAPAVAASAMALLAKSAAGVECSVLSWYSCSQLLLGRCGLPLLPPPLLLLADLLPPCHQSTTPCCAPLHCRALPASRCRPPTPMRRTTTRRPPSLSPRCTACMVRCCCLPPVASAYCVALPWVVMLPACKMQQQQTPEFKMHRLHGELLCACCCLLHCSALEVDIDSLQAESKRRRYTTRMVRCCCLLLCCSGNIMLRVSARPLQGWFRSRTVMLLPTAAVIQHPSDPLSSVPTPGIHMTGTVHSNGFGHLARLNGREGGSKRASGRQLMQVRWCDYFR